MSTLAQIDALKHDLAELSKNLADVENRSRLAKQSLQCAKRKSFYLSAAYSLRKPAERYSLWNFGVLIVGPAAAVVLAFIAMTVVGVPSGFKFYTALLTALAALSLLAVMLKFPATSELPKLIADQRLLANQFQAEATRLDEEATILQQKISLTKNTINELLESDRLKRELLLKQNWKAMRGPEWEQYLVQVFDALGASAETTRTTGDQGVDLLVRFGQMMIAVQAKGYVGSVGNEAVQQVVAGKVHYGCDRAAVITNSRFTAPARALAASNQCFLIGEKEFPAFVFGSNLELFK